MAILWLGFIASVFVNVFLITIVLLARSEYKYIERLLDEKEQVLDTRRRNYEASQDEVLRLKNLVKVYEENHDATSRALEKAVSDLKQMHLYIEPLVNYWRGEEGGEEE